MTTLGEKKKMKRQRKIIRHTYNNQKSKQKNQSHNLTLT